ncbi:hypothetical protein D9757_003705 [Collybiopsis confluens]|uniref:Actin-bundling protein n=1 Tax=Collybiopsis confluens TaxID=2823264 RepID=A0A8H5MDM3_9AGAR|nr:hypothetical protein D9757_003705 [Collybiopsis confluens]
MGDDKIRSTKLRFKGEQHKKKRRRDDDHDEGGSRGKRRKEDNVDPDTWVFPENPAEIRGPTFILHPSDPSPISLNFSTATNRVVLHILDKEKSEVDAPPPPLLERTPTDVAQVWVTTRVAGATTINIRSGSGEGKFLSANQFGIVSCDRDARGPQEEWTPVIMPDGMVALMNSYEKYLSIDEVAGGSIQLRADSEEVGFKERFWLKIQNKYKQEANDEEKKKEGMVGPPEIDETGTNHLYQAWGAGRSMVSKEDKKELKRARKEGRLAEALLDRRAKLKSDRFC